VVFVKEAALFVDESFVYKIWKASEHGNINYTDLRRVLEEKYLDSESRITEAYYFNADDDPPKASTSAFNEQLKILYPNGPGFRVKLYWLSKKRIFWPSSMGGGQVVHPETGAPFVQATQKGVDVGLALHLIKSFHRRHWRTLFLAAGDGDFSEVIEYLVEEHGVDVYLIGAEGSVSVELQQYVRGLIEIADIADEVRLTANMTSSAQDSAEFVQEIEVVVKLVNKDLNYGIVTLPNHKEAIMRSNENRKLVWPPNQGDRLVGKIQDQYDSKRKLMGLKLVEARPI
jgi:uncharacterized LabA/DUF88 family protein